MALSTPISKLRTIGSVLFVSLLVCFSSKWRLAGGGRGLAGQGKKASQPSFDPPKDQKIPSHHHLFDISCQNRYFLACNGTKKFCDELVSKKNRKGPHRLGLGNGMHQSQVHCSEKKSIKEKGKEDTIEIRDKYNARGWILCPHPPIYPLFANIDQNLQKATQNAQKTFENVPFGNFNIRQVIPPKLHRFFIFKT